MDEKRFSSQLFLIAPQVIGLIVENTILMKNERRNYFIRPNYTRSWKMN